MKRTITLQQDYDEMDEERPKHLYLTNFLSKEEAKIYHREAQAKYMAKNKESVLGARRKRYSTNPKVKEKSNAKSKEYYVKNKEKILAKRKEQRGATV